MRCMSNTRRRTTISVAYAAVAYAAFVITTLWAIAFLADRPSLGIDRGAHPAALGAVGLDLALLLVFAVQHTVMARPAFKRWVTARIPAGVERSTYVLAASAALALLFWGWRPVGGEAWHVHDAAGVALWICFATGWLVAISSTFMIDHLDFLGVRRAYRFGRGRDQTTPSFQERWLFAWVRHPLMLGLLIAFWATPRMTGGHLLFALAATGYIEVGLRFEERGLVAEFGDLYCDYASRVPAVLPIRIPERQERVRITSTAPTIGRLRPTGARRDSDDEGSRAGAGRRPEGCRG